MQTTKSTSTPKILLIAMNPEQMTGSSRAIHDGVAQGGRQRFHNTPNTNNYAYLTCRTCQQVN